MALIPLTPAVQRQLAQAYGDADRAEAARTAGMARAKPSELNGAGEKLQERVVQINDLHMNAGRLPGGAYYEGEDFTAEQGRELGTWLSKEWVAAAKGNVNSLHPSKQSLADALSELNWASGRKVDISKVADILGTGKYDLKLCLDGDVVDLLRTTTELPGYEFPSGKSKKGVPKNTPANMLVVLNTIWRGHREAFRMFAAHLRFGHSIDYIPGNHDAQLLNPKVWSGEYTLPNGNKVLGFTKILEQELREMGAGPKEIAQCMKRLKLKTFANYANKFVDHGHMADQYNKLQRPLKELLEPSDWHEEMAMTYGDYGVRGGFNQIDELDPRLAAIDDKWLFVRHAAAHPVEMYGLYKAFLLGAEQEGYKVSPEDDKAQRMADLATLVERFPDVVDELNKRRPEGDKFSKEDVIRGLQNIEEVSAVPFYSRFKAGCRLFTRIGQLGLSLAKGKLDMRDKFQINAERGLAAQEAFGLDGISEGHTHHARFDTYLTPDLKQFTRMDTHTWMTKEGDWGRPEVTWNEDGRGVGVFETGVDKYGNPWADMRLEKVIDDRGSLVEGDLLAEEDPDAEANEKRVAALLQQHGITAA
jgi:UDP-2,3-diacylglucosamine pyrophosphatase LpxH